MAMLVLDLRFPSSELALIGLDTVVFVLRLTLDSVRGWKTGVHGRVAACLDDRA